MDYLQNAHCAFTPLFDINYEKKINIFSVSLFKMYNGGYKSFDMYKTGLSLLSKYITVNKLDFKIRLFIDNSIYLDKELLTHINSLDHIQIVLYTCNNYTYYINHHIGLFGTIVRFFPMFNFKNNDSNTVIILDADYTEKEFDNFLIYENYKFLKSKKIIDKIYFHVYGRLVYSVRNNHLIIKKRYIIPYILASHMIGCKKIPNIILIKYLDDVKENSNKKTLTDYIIIEGTRKKKCESYNEIIICFGIDEYFLNNYLINYLIKKKLGLSIYLTYNIIIPLFFKNPILTKNYKNIPKYNEYLKEIVGQYIPNITYDTYDKLDSLIYDHNHEEFTLNKIQNDIYSNIIKLYKKLNENKDYQIFEKDLLNVLNMKEFKNIVKMRLYYFYFFDHEKIIISKVKLNK